MNDLIDHGRLKGGVQISMTISTGLGGNQFILECAKCHASTVVEGESLENLIAHLTALRGQRAARNGPGVKP